MVRGTLVMGMPRCMAASFIAVPGPAGHDALDDALGWGGDFGRRRGSLDETPDVRGGESAEERPFTASAYSG